LDFFFFFFFFMAMMITLVFVMNLTAGLVQSQVKSRPLSPRPLTVADHATAGPAPQSKSENNLYFSVA
jgi:hypothetical protein